MASTRQVRAAKQNVKKAQKAARQKRTIANLPEKHSPRAGKQAAKWSWRQVWSPSGSEPERGFVCGEPGQ